MKYGMHVGCQYELYVTHDAKEEHFCVRKPFTGVYCKAGKTCLVAGIPYMMYIT